MKCNNTVNGEKCNGKVIIPSHPSAMQNWGWCLTCCKEYSEEELRKLDQH